MNISRRSRHDVHGITITTRYTSTDVNVLRRSRHDMTFTTRCSLNEVIDFFLNAVRPTWMFQDAHATTFTTHCSGNELIDFFKTRQDQRECYKTSTTRRSRHDVHVNEVINFFLYFKTFTIRRSRHDVPETTWLIFFKEKKLLDQRECYKTSTTRRSRHHNHDTMLTLFKKQFDRCECFKTFTTRV